MARRRRRVTQSAYPRTDPRSRSAAEVTHPRYEQTGGRAVASSTEHPQPANAAEALEHLGRLSLRELSMEDLLQTVADLAETVMPGNPEASVTLLVEDRPATVATTGRMALALDESQYDRGHGPCL